MEIVSLQNNNALPKYKQIVLSIENAIADGFLKKGDKLPSLNAIKNKHSLSRDTVLTAFSELKNRGIINSVVGKGYYVTSTEITVEKKVFLLFDELNSFKEDLYNSFLEHLGDNIQVDIFFHHFNLSVFNKHINDNVGNYNYYVIMPANLENTKNAVLNLPEENVFILDQVPKELSKYPSVFQNFEKDIYSGLLRGIEDIKKYEKIVLVFSDVKQPVGILKGFLKFCKDHSLKHKVIPSIKGMGLSENEIYFVLDDKNLIRVIKKIKEQQFLIAKNVGIVSLNDTILKEVVANGINTISTNFNFMGQTLAEMILNNNKGSLENPSNYIKRNSL